MKHQQCITSVNERNRSQSWTTFNGQWEIRILVVTSQLECSECLSVFNLGSRLGFLEASSTLLIQFQNNYAWIRAMFLKTDFQGCPCSTLFENTVFQRYSLPRSLNMVVINLEIPPFLSAQNFGRNPESILFSLKCSTYNDIYSLQLTFMNVFLQIKNDKHIVCTIPG